LDLNSLADVAIFTRFRAISSQIKIRKVQKRYPAC